MKTIISAINLKGLDDCTRKITIILGLLVCFINSYSQKFIGETGIYILNPANVPISNALYEKTYISGGIARTKWEDLELSPGNFDWTFLDGEIQKAESVNKKLCIAIFKQPLWLVDSLEAESYLAVDYNIHHSSYLDTFRYAIKYDPVVISRYKVLMDSLAKHYSGNPVISYFHLFSSVSNDLPLTVADGSPYYQAKFYNPDTLVTRLKDLTNYYMKLFPETPLWNSPDGIRFEKDATGFPKNYVAKNFVYWGAKTYPKRFGVWREDLSGCVIVTAKRDNTHWYVMSQHGCRNGAQMVWNTQDGPSRMNNCDMTAEDDSQASKIMVLDSAINAGLSINMRYFEIYRADLMDPELDSILKALHKRINIQIDQNCSANLSTPILKSNDGFKVYPVPSAGLLNIISRQQIQKIEVCNLYGQLVFIERNIKKEVHQIDISHFPEGVYILKSKTDVKVNKKRILISTQDF